MNQQALSALADARTMVELEALHEAHPGWRFRPIGTGRFVGCQERFHPRGGTTTRYVSGDPRQIGFEMREHEKRQRQRTPPPATTTRED